MSSDSARLKKPGSDPQIRLKSRLLPVMVVVLLVLQITLPYRGWVILLVGMGGGWLISYLWARSLARNLRLFREVRYGWAQVGDRLQERFTLVNDGWAAATWAELEDFSTLPEYRASRVTGVDGMSMNRWRLSSVCTRRGLFTIGPTSLQTGDPFGLYTVNLHYPESTSLLVTPPVVPLPSIEIAPGGRAGEGRPRANALEPTVSAAGVRDYTAGDSLRWIHWRSTAHRGALSVRLFESTPASDWWIFLDLNQDVQVGEGWDSTEEHGVVLAASLADRGLRSGRAVGLVTHGEELIWLPPQSGEDQRLEILRALALVSPGSRPLEDFLARAGPISRQRASLIIITPAVGGDWIEGLFPLLQRGAIPTVLLLDPVSFGGTGDASNSQRLLSSLGIAHYMVTPSLLDRPEARPGRLGHWEWRVLPTGRAIAVSRPTDMAWEELS